MSSRIFWGLIGSLLFLWVGYDLVAGYTLLHDVIYRDVEPTLYWIGIGLWSLVAASCFISWGGEQ